MSLYVLPYDLRDDADRYPVIFVDMGYSEPYVVFFARHFAVVTRMGHRVDPYIQPHEHDPFAHIRHPARVSALRPAFTQVICFVAAADAFCLRPDLHFFDGFAVYRSDSDG